MYRIMIDVYFSLSGSNIAYMRKRVYYFFSFDNIRFKNHLLKCRI